VVVLKEQLKRLKKDKASDADVATLETQIRDAEKSVRDLEAQAAAIDAAVFDLKAVNPNASTKVDARTPSQIIQNIQDQGRIVAESLSTLSTLLNRSL
jgi:type I restriction enzyme M protein